MPVAVEVFRPRKMLPPPTTTVTDTPSALTSLICRARSSNTCGSMPKPSLPCNASPLSFRTIRVYFGTPEDPLVDDFFMDDRTAVVTSRSGRFPQRRTEQTAESRHSHPFSRPEP